MKRQYQYPEIPKIEKEIDYLIKQIETEINRLENLIAKIKIVEKGLVGTKEVDESAIDDGKILAYNSIKGKLEYQNK